MTLTKSWLQKQITDLEATRDEIPFGLTGKESKTLAAFKLALASLEAEPVEWRVAFRLDGQSGSDFEKTFEDQAKMNEIISLHERAGFSTSITPLFTATPAPVSVPDAIEPTVEAIKRILPTSNPDGYAACIGADMWNACRAAMLQGADGNSPVIPDGWVACVERMPSAGEQVLAYRPDAPESNDPLIKMATYVGGSAHGHGFDCYCKPTHWMPLPAAPQQED